MRLSFDSIAEVQEFVKGLKGTRNKKDGETDDAAGGNSPAPLMPGPNMSGGPSFSPAGYAPQGLGAAPGGAAFPAAGASGPAPEVLALVQRLSSRIDWCLMPQPQGGGAKADDILNWFRTQCGPETAQYTMDQIKQSALPRLAPVKLDEMAKLMNA